MNSLRNKRKKTKRRVRAKISGTGQVPRISLYRTNKHIYAQVIDDEKAVTLCAASDISEKTKGKTKVERAMELGEKIGVLMKDKKVQKAVIDRSYYKYTGRVKAFADSVRKSGITI